VIQLLQPFVFVTLAYWLINLNDEFGRYLNFLMIMLLAVMVGYSWGYLISCITGNLALALVVTGSLSLPLALFGGFFVIVSTIPYALVWISYCSFYTFAFEALMTMIWEGVNLDYCDKDADDGCYFQTGAEVLAHYGLNPDLINADIVVLIVHFVVLRFLAYYFLWKRSIEVSKTIDQVR